MRDDVAKGRAEAMAWRDNFEAHEEVTHKTCMLRRGRKPISCRWQDIHKGDSERAEVRSRLIARELEQKWTDFAGTPPLAHERYVISSAATKTKTGRRRQLMVLEAMRAFLHADALTEAHAHLRDTRDAGA